MSDTTKIEWADSTFNPWIGCTKVGPGCDNCYAEADFDLRKRRAKWGAGQARSRTSESNWNLPLRWNQQHDEFFAAHGRRRRVFCASLADVFDNDVPTEWRMDLFSLIAQTPNLDWLILTKRIGNVMKMCQADGLMFDMICDRVWLGATICTQPEADRDIFKLLATPARIHWLSMEPLLSPVDLTPHLWGRAAPCAECPKDGDCDCSYMARTEMPDEPGIDWIVVGGESGPKARPMHPDWVRSLRDQCAAAGVPFLFKQWGEYLSAELDECPCGPPDKAWMWADGAPWSRFDGQRGVPLFRRVGKNTAGRMLDGKQHNEYPVPQ